MRECNLMVSFYHFKVFLACASCNLFSWSLRIFKYRTHTHTHTHTYIYRERERENEKM